MDQSRSAVLAVPRTCHTTRTTEVAPGRSVRVGAQLSPPGPVVRMVCKQGVVGSNPIVPPNVTRDPRCDDPRRLALIVPLVDYRYLHATFRISLGAPRAFCYELDYWTVVAADDSATLWSLGTCVRHVHGSDEGLLLGFGQGAADEGASSCTP
jgi:hypothetical protein